jgi:hypothetical protein
VTVAAAASHVELEAHAVTGDHAAEDPGAADQRAQLPSAGFLEPGVTASRARPRSTLALLGLDPGRRFQQDGVTVDGGVRNSIEGNTSMNFSQEVVEEFSCRRPLRLSTGVTSVGAVNIVTRSGRNDMRGSTFSSTAIQHRRVPGAQARPLAPDPFFARRNPGVWLGGPIAKDRLFYFSNYEYTNQEAVVSFQPNLASAASLGGVFSNPYRGHLFSARVDWKASNKNTAFVRFSHDQNKGFGPSGGAVLPSNWLRNENKSDQMVVGLTSILKSSLLNDFRFNFTYWRNRNLFANETTCGDCVGLGFPQLSINGTNVTVGNTSNATQGRDLCAIRSSIR